METCPSCGDVLESITDPDGQTAPFVCRHDARGWWPAELTAEARRLWDPRKRSHGPSEAGQEVRRATRREQAVAIRREQEGTPPESPYQTPPEGGA